MSLLTRCPACSTIYRVVPDQLRISDGWVKCGQCSEIFDASKQLIEVTDPTPPLVASEPPADKPEAVDQPPPAAVEAAVADEAVNTAETTAAPVSHPPDAPPAGNTTVAPQLRWDDPPDTPNSNPAPPVAASLEGPLPSFLAQNASHSTWKKPLVRGLLVLTAGALGLALLGQWLYAEKDRLAAQYPALKMSLEQFCTLSNCTLQPFRQIESLSVDSVGFSQLGKETYRLNFVVKNASTLPLALPAIELTLTDAQDEPVYRRVFNSAELADNRQLVNAGAEWAASVALKVDPDSASEPVRGYRLLIFYP